jgi:hypothetical protein
MGKSRIQTRVEPDTEHQIDKYAEDRDIGESEAIRRLIRSGLAAEGYPVTFADGGRLNRIASTRTVLGGAVVLLLGVGLLAIAATGATGGSIGLALAMLGLATVTMLLGLLTMLAAVVANIALGHSTRDLLTNWRSSA